MEYPSKVNAAELNEIRKIYEKKYALLNLQKILTNNDDELMKQVEENMDMVNSLETNWWRHILKTDKESGCRFFVNLSTGEVKKEENLCTKRN